MTSRLSSDQIEQLSPLLGSLARLIARGAPADERQLRMLISATDLEPSGQVVQELQRWAGFLLDMRGWSDDTLRQTVVESLMLRGLPEAPVLLAVSEVAAAPPVPSAPPSSPTASPQSPASTPAGQLWVSTDSVELKAVRVGRSASAEFDVRGGPGHVDVDNDQVRVTPAQFGPDTTRIRVEVCPIVSGMIWTPVRLLTAAETREVNVVAQVIDSAESAQFVDAAGQNVVLRSAEELLRFCDANWQEATGYLADGRVQEFLDSIEAAEAAQSAAVCSALPDRNIALERFLRDGLSAKPPDFRANDFEVISALGYGPKPVFFRQPERVTLLIENCGKRGYLYGHVQPLVPWLSVPRPRFGCLPSETAEVELVVDKSKKAGLLKQLFSAGEELYEIVTE